MVIPLAVAFDCAVSLKASGDLMTKRRIRGELRRWFVFVCGGTRCIRTLHQLVACDSTCACGQVLRRGTMRSRFEECLMPTPVRVVKMAAGAPAGWRARRTNALEAAVLALVVVRSGRDWLHGKKLLPESAVKNIEAHHIIPRKADGVPGWRRVGLHRELLTPQSAPSNKQLGNKFPVEAGVTGEVAAAHFCDFLEIGATDQPAFERFVKRRAAELHKAIERADRGYARPSGVSPRIRPMV